MKIVTGKTGEPHVTSVDDRLLHQHMWGESGVLSISKMPEVISASIIRIYPCDILFQGCYARILEGQYEDITFDSPKTGERRIDLIVARYTMNDNGIENMSLNIIKGASVVDTQEPQIPSYQRGDINSGAWQADMPLFTIAMNGLSISDPVAVAKILPSMTDKYNKDDTYSRDEIGELLSNERTDTSNQIMQLAGEVTEADSKAENALRAAETANSAIETTNQMLEEVSSSVTKASNDIDTLSKTVDNIADDSIVITGISGVTVTIPGTESSSPVSSVAVTLPAATSRVIVVPKTIPDGVTYRGYDIISNPLAPASGEYTLTVVADTKNKADTSIVVIVIGVVRLKSLLNN